MMPSKAALWARYQKYYTEFASLGLSVDLSRVNFPDGFLTTMERPLRRVFSTMAELEKGAIANPDEKRMMGHYWLRAPQLAPTPALTAEIEQTLVALRAFAADVHAGRRVGSAGPFRNVLIIGIGGSALGPQFVAKALGHLGSDRLKPYFFDNTDPDGMDAVRGELPGQLGQTLAVVIFKSGGTPETRNGMLEARAAYERAGLSFARHAVAVTGAGSALG